MLNTLHTITPQRFFDTRGFGTNVPAGEYAVSPPYPDTDEDDTPFTNPADINESKQILGVKVCVKLIPDQSAGFLIAYTDPGQTPSTSIIDFAANAPGAGCNPPAYNTMLDLPVTPQGHFQVFINVPASIVVDLYGYWT